jgi:hypothetical protein
MPDFAGEVLALCSWSGKIFSWSGKIFATDRSPEVVLIPNGEFKISHYRPMPATRATRRLASKAAFVRSSARFRYDKGVRYYANGFRVARDLQAGDGKAPTRPPKAVVAILSVSALTERATALSEQQNNSSLR